MGNRTAKIPLSDVCIDPDDALVAQGSLYFCVVRRKVLRRIASVLFRPAHERAAAAKPCVDVGATWALGKGLDTTTRTTPHHPVPPCRTVKDFTTDSDTVALQESWLISELISLL